MGVVMPLLIKSSSLLWLVKIYYYYEIGIYPLRASFAQKISILVIIIMTKNRKNFQSLSGCRKVFPALSWPQNASVDLKYGILCM